MIKNFKKILVANRGEIACRVFKTAKAMGIQTVAVYSDADKYALHVPMADEAVYIGAAPSAESYLVIDKIIEACKQTGAEAVHPGYGFLSEQAEFAKRLAEENIAFIGPPSSAIEQMGDKITSKKIAADAGVSTVPGYMGLIDDEVEAAKIAAQIGYPVMIKASAGGGGKGMRIAWNDAEAREGFERSKSEAASSFGDDRIFIEKFVTEPRHIEIQILADNHGNCVYLHERECSIQRRNQKVIEEAPSPFLDDKTRKAMGEQSVALANAVGYVSAGTVEFIVDKDRNFYFLEMNTRLQVEHPVTELITGIDLVEQMIRVAQGEVLTLKQEEIQLNGWAMESRLYAEDPYRNFLPSIGRLTRYRPPQEGMLENGAIIRNDTGVFEGGEISMFYDPMIAKLCTWAPKRLAAIDVMQLALDQFEVEGIGHNLPFCAAVMSHERFRSGNITTAFIAEEYPEGFEGVPLTLMQAKALAGFGACLKVQEEIRQIGALKNTAYRAKIEEYDFDINLKQIEDSLFALRFDTEEDMIYFNVDNIKGSILKSFSVKDLLGVKEESYFVKVNSCPTGYRLRYQAADVILDILPPHIADLNALMPEKVAPDTSNMLLCPMPGLVVKLHVSEGEKVEEGQSLAIIEAMKMENLLRAEKAGVISKIHAKEGDSLAVDVVIMEFEA